MDLASKNPPGGPNCDARHHTIATMLLVHGDQDPFAPIKQSEIMESAMKRRFTLRWSPANADESSLPCSCFDALH